jgi:copper chaperone
MSVEILKVEGMSCDHCVQSITKAVKQLDGISSVQVDLASKTVTVDFQTDQSNLAQIKEAIEDQGYEI